MVFIFSRSPAIPVKLVKCFQCITLSSTMSILHIWLCMYPLLCANTCVVCQEAFVCSIIIYIMIFLCYYINIEWTTLRPMAFMFRPENHCSLQLLFATMNQDGEVWSWTIISRIVPRWNYFSMHCFVSFLWPKSKVACLGFPVLTNVLRCPGDRVPVECCVKVNDLQLNGCCISKREALSVLQQAMMRRNPINLTPLSIPTSSKVPWVLLTSVCNPNLFWVFTILMYPTRMGKVVKQILQRFQVVSCSM